MITGNDNAIFFGNFIFFVTKLKTPHINMITGDDDVKFPDSPNH
jgi:hypothetical protein